MRRAASLVRMKGAVTLKWKAASKKRSLVSMAALGMAPPALFTAMSSRPNSRTAASTSCSSWPRSVTSVGTASARRPWASTSAATSSRSEAVRAARTTSAPAWARPTAMPAADAEPGPGHDRHAVVEAEAVEDHDAGTLRLRPRRNEAAARPATSGISR